ncbi:MAG: FAD-dependent oxidoreductase [Oscillospiraceae bacterium]|nr:FAD-dependent oxidoreductase [Oscillospiraceae bacterium]
MKVIDRGTTEIFVAGGGVAGVAAALSAARQGKKVILAEKTVMLGGLATLGLVNLFVAMCNGRGKQIAFGMAEEFARLSVKYGYGDLTPQFVDGAIPREKLDEYAAIGKKPPRYKTNFSPEIFALQLTELLHDAGVTILFDSIVTDVTMCADDPKRARSVTLLTASGFERYGAQMFVDATGSAQLAYLAGMRVKTGRNYHIFSGMEVSLERCQNAIDAQDIEKLFVDQFGGRANLYGGNQPEGMEPYDGTSSDEVNTYFLRNHLEMLAHYKDAENRKKRDLVTTAGMPQFREVRCIEGDYAFRAEDAYRHFDDSVAAIPDFARRDYLYEVPLRCLTQKEFPNVVAAGRVAAAEGYGWDVLRVIPPAILTGQAAGTVCVHAIEEKKPVAQVDIAALQKQLAKDGVLIHFDDADIPPSSDGTIENSDKF